MQMGVGYSLSRFAKINQSDSDVPSVGENNNNASV